MALNRTTNLYKYHPATDVAGYATKRNWFIVPNELLDTK